MRARNINRKHFDRKADQIEAMLRSLGAPKFGVFYIQAPPKGERGQIHMFTNFTEETINTVLARVLRKGRLRRSQQLRRSPS